MRARSSADTLQLNNTVDRLVPPQQINPAATLAIDQAFHQQSATLGDVVTLQAFLRKTAWACDTTVRVKAREWKPNNVCRLEVEEWES